MKILLINPSTKNMITTNVPALVEEERGHSPPLGLLYIASYIRENTVHEVSVLDADVEELDYNQITKRIESMEPDIVGITTTTFTLIDAIDMANLVKSVNNDIKVIMGGVHVNIYPNETISTPSIDALVLGEGEAPFADLLDNMDCAKKVKGIVVNNDGRVINTGSRELITDLDKLPFPARDMTPYKKYSSLIARHSPTTTILTSRGCPFRCSFCFRPHLGKIFRARSATNVVDEMEQCVGMGIKEILIYDDTFTVDKRRVIDICSEIKRRRLNVAWDVRARVDTVNSEMLGAMKQSGCERIHYGVEAGDNRTLKVLNKGITIHQVNEAFKMTKDVGMDTLAYFIIGNPEETSEMMLNTVEFAKQLDPDFVHFSVLTPFPATPIYLDGIRKGMFGDVWKDFARYPVRTFQPPLWEQNLSRDELIEMLFFAFKSFYLRKRYIIKRLMKVRSVGEFTRKVKAGMRFVYAKEKQEVINER